MGERGGGEGKRRNSFGREEISSSVGTTGRGVFQRKKKRGVKSFHGGCDRGGGGGRVEGKLWLEG